MTVTITNRPNDAPDIVVQSYIGGPRAYNYFPSSSGIPHDNFTFNNGMFYADDAVVTRFHINSVRIDFGSQDFFADELPVANLSFFGPFIGETLTLDAHRTRLDIDDYSYLVVERTIMIQSGWSPGWENGQKEGWDGGVPPGLGNNDKTPDGFEKGNKEGWE